MVAMGAAGVDVEVVRVAEPKAVVVVVVAVVVAVAGVVVGGTGDVGVLGRGLGAAEACTWR